MNLKCYSVWSTITYNQLKLKVVEQKGNQPVCTGCVFSRNTKSKYNLKNISCTSHGLGCTPYSRKDKKHIIFKVVE